MCVLISSSSAKALDEFIKIYSILKCIIPAQYPFDPTLYSSKTDLNALQVQ